MTFLHGMRIGLVLVGLAGAVGCSDQDPDQPAMGSISVGARKDDSGLNLPTDKTKAALVPHK